MMFYFCYYGASVKMIDVIDNCNKFDRERGNERGFSRLRLLQPTRCGAQYYQNQSKMKILIFVLFAQLSKCEESSAKIHYELVEMLFNYEYERSNHSEDVVTSKKNAFSITVLSDVPVLRQGMLDIGPDTYYFWMDGRKLEELEPGVFDNQNITEEIRLERNELTVIKTGTFKNLKIKKLDLAYNKITHVEEKAISDLPNLWEVHLLRNKIVQFHDNSFVNTPSMWAFDMSCNKLEKLGKGWFRFMTKNKTVIIGVAHNEIREIDSGAFEGINVWNLALDHNKLEQIPEEVFTKNNIQLLYIEDNQLESLPEGFFGQKNLIEVGIRNNRWGSDFQRKLEGFTKEIRARTNSNSVSC
jgi:Leucine-rich repeat (LRR) protein